MRYAYAYIILCVCEYIEYERHDVYSPSLRRHSMTGQWYELTYIPTTVLMMGASGDGGVSLGVGML